MSRALNAGRWLVRRPRRLLAAALVAAVAAVVGAHVWAADQLRRAEQAYRADRIDAAGRHTANCLRVWWWRSSPHLMAARVARVRGEFAVAEHHLNRCKQIEGQTTERAQTEWILLRAAAGDVDSVAEGLWRCVTPQHPDALEIVEGLTRAYINVLRYQSALRCLNRWLELEPTSALALHWRGWVFDRINMRDDAVADYKRCLELDPERFAARLLLGNLLIEGKSDREALEQFQILVRQRPDSADARVGLGRCLMATGEPDAAREAFEFVLVRDPDHATATLHLARLENQSGNHARAEELLRRRLQADPNDLESNYALYQSLQAQPERAVDARAQLERFETMNAEMRKLDELLRFKIEMNRNNPDVLAEAGDLLVRLGNAELGRYWLNAALLIDPHHRAARRALAAYYDKVNDPDKAAEQRRLADPGTAPP